MSKRILEIDEIKAQQYDDGSVATSSGA